MTTNREQTVHASIARTVDPTDYELVLRSGEARTGIRLTINCSATSATPSVVFTIKGYDPVSGGTYTILASAAITATGITTLQIGPGLVAVTNLAAQALIPNRLLITAVHNDTDSITYSVGLEIS